LFKLVLFVQKINAPELLRLYLSYGFLEESTELATEYILATMGRGKEYFGLDVSESTISCRHVCLKVTFL